MCFPKRPSATTLAEFDRITAAAEEHGVLFFPFQNSRFYPYFRKIREVIASGVLGEIICIRSNWSGFARRWDWQTLQRECAGNLLNTGPHPVDQAVVLFGDAYPEVFCRMAAYHFDFGGDADNFCALTLYGKGRPTIEVQVSSFLAYPQGEQYNIRAPAAGFPAAPPNSAGSISIRSPRRSIRSGNRGVSTGSTAAKRSTGRRKAGVSPRRRRMRTALYR